jgi:carbon starvation protein
VYGAVFIANPIVVAPAFNTDVPAGAPPIVPLLFVTIACGAISGFHGLVSSGTTSKQLNTETDARFVGYLGSLGEGGLALAAIIATTAGFASLAEWKATYAAFGDGGIAGFVAGGATIVTAGLGLPREFATTLLAVMAVLFAGTTMDAGVRLQRYIVQEWGNIYKIPPLQNGYVATFVAVGSCLALAFGAGGVEGKGGMIIWPLFGTTNQLLAGLTLMVISVMLVKLGRPSIFTIVPMVFVTAMSFFSAIYQLWDLYTSANYLLVAIDILIIIAAIFVMLESFSTFWREKKAGAYGSAQD